MVCQGLDCDFDDDLSLKRYVNTLGSCLKHSLVIIAKASQCDNRSIGYPADLLVLMFIGLVTLGSLQ